MRVTQTTKFPLNHDKISLTLYNTYIIDLIKDLKPIIGRPRDFTRHIHVEKDNSGEFGLKGLPTEWTDLLREAGFSAEDFLANKKEIVKVLILS